MDINEIKIIYDNDIHRDKWISFLHSNPFASPFQTPGFYDFCNSVPGISAHAISIEKMDRISALCVITLLKEKGLRSYFSRRAIIYGGPLFGDNESAHRAAGLLIREINRIVRKYAIYGEIRNSFDYSMFTRNYEQQGWKYSSHLNLRINLEGKDKGEILNEMKYNRKREIRLSQEQGAGNRVAESEKDIEQLYDILRDLYLRRVKLPLPGIDFFIKLFQSDIGKVFLVDHNNRIIGGSFCIFYPGLSVYTMYYCGLRNYHKKNFPTHLAIIAAIEFGLGNNLQTVDLMGAGKPDEDYGVRRYKSEFGGDLVEFGRYLKIDKSLFYFLGNIGISIMRKINR